MELEDARVYLKKVSNEYRVYGDLDNPEFEDTRKISEAIETVLQELESYKIRYELAIEQNIKDYKTSIPKKKIEEKLNELLNKLADADLGDFYDEVRDIKEELLWEEEECE